MKKRLISILLVGFLMFCMMPVNIEAIPPRGVDGRWGDKLETGNGGIDPDPGNGNNNGDNGEGVVPPLLPPNGYGGDYDRQTAQAPTSTPTPTPARIVNEIEELAESIEEVSEVDEEVIFMPPQVVPEQTEPTVPALAIPPFAVPEVVVEAETFEDEESVEVSAPQVQPTHTLELPEESVNEQELVIAELITVEYPISIHAEASLSAASKGIPLLYIVAGLFLVAAGITVTVLYKKGVILQGRLRKD